MKSLSLALAAAAAAALWGAPARAQQAPVNYCLNVLDLLCGGLDADACLSRDAMWSYVPPACEGEMQTQVENAREFHEQNGRGAGRVGMEEKYGEPARPYRGDSGAIPNMQEKFGEPRGYTDAPAYGRGFSYGGVLRAGPGMQFGKIGSLRDGDWLEIIEDTGVNFDGYHWFRVRSAVGEGYHWGGIFCTEGGHAQVGVFSSCN